jgi:hypothetical protein
MLERKLRESKSEFSLPLLENVMYFGLRSPELNSGFKTALLTLDIPKARDQSMVDIRALSSILG